MKQKNSMNDLRKPIDSEICANHFMPPVYPLRLSEIWISQVAPVKDGVESKKWMRMNPLPFASPRAFPLIHTESRQPYKCRPGTRDEVRGCFPTLNIIMI